MVAFAVSTLLACKKSSDSASQSTPVSVPQGTLPTAYANRLNQVFDSVCSAISIKGATASIIVPNVGIWNKVYGLSHTGAPVTTNMVFPMGSNTKTFTGVVMLRLQEKGLLSFTDTIGKWIKGYANINGKITIQQLLNHYSGLYNYTDNAAFDSAVIADFHKVWNPIDVLQFVKQPINQPGVEFSYCSSNTLIAGIIAEKVSGLTMMQLVQQYVLTPASLKNTYYYPWQSVSGPTPHLWSAGLSQGAIEDLQATYNYVPAAFHSAAGAAGGMMCTAEDNARFWFQLMNGNILSQALLDQMKQTAATSSPNAGYGICIVKITNRFGNNRVIYSHNGGVWGGVNENAYDETSGICISIHTNQDNVNLEPLIKAVYLVTLNYNK